MCAKIIIDKKSLFAILLGIITYAGCGMNNEGTRIIEELKSSNIQTIYVFRQKGVRKTPAEYVECPPEEVDFFKTISLPAMTNEKDKKMVKAVGQKIKVKLDNGKEYEFFISPMHWQDAKTQIKDGTLIREPCYRVKSDISWRYGTLAEYLRPPMSTPPKLPYVLGDSLKKYEQYFQDISEKSSLNKRRLAAFFQEIADRRAWWGEVRKNDQEFFEKLGDFLLTKGDNITYDDFLKIIGAWDLPNSSAPVPTKWKP